MFNLSAFNQTPFNGVGYNGIPIYTVASMHMTAVGSCYADKAMSAAAHLRANTLGRCIRFRPFDGKANMEMTAKGNLIRFKFGSSDIDMVMDASALGYRTYGTKQLELQNIDLHVGDEVIINTDDMTVTINGQNAVSFLSDDSDFFKLKPGENFVLISGSAGAVADTYIIWKDRWL